MFLNLEVFDIIGMTCWHDRFTSRVWLIGPVSLAYKFSTSTGHPSITRELIDAAGIMRVRESSRERVPQGSSLPLAVV